MGNSGSLIISPFLKLVSEIDQILQDDFTHGGFSTGGQQTTENPNEKILEIVL